VYCRQLDSVGVSVAGCGSLGNDLRCHCYMTSVRPDRIPNSVDIVTTQAKARPWCYNLQVRTYLVGLSQTHQVSSNLLENISTLDDRQLCSFCALSILELRQILLARVFPDCLMFQKFLDCRYSAHFSKVTWTAALSSSLGP